MQICILKCVQEYKMGKHTVKLIILYNDNFGENLTPPHRNGMTAIPKTCPLCLSRCMTNDMQFAVTGVSAVVAYL